MDVDISVSTSSAEDVLNDDCIQEIFRRIKTIPVYLSAALTCSRFQQNAKVCFPFKSVSVDFSGPIVIGGAQIPDYFSRRTESSVPVPLDLLESFLSVFGPVIKSIHLRQSRDIREYTKNDTIFNMIAESCGKTLVQLHIWEGNLNMNTRSEFYSLETLDFTSVKFQCSGRLPKSKRINFNSIIEDPSRYEWLKNHFPGLEEVDLIGLVNVSNDLIVEFLKNNSQLKSLKIWSRNVNLEIEEEILKCKRMKHLDMFIDVTFAMSLVRELPKLEELTIIMTAETINNTSVIKEIIEHAKCLTEFNIHLSYTSTLTMNRQLYNSILSMAEGHCTVHFYCYRNRLVLINVDEETIKANSRWLFMHLWN